MKLPFSSQNKPAEDDEIAALKEVAGFPLPSSYIALLQYSNGGEWPIPVSPFSFLLFEVDAVIGNMQGTDFTEVYPDCVPIGGDGMSEYVALDFSEDGPPRVVAIDAMEDDRSEALYPVANSFEAFLALIGQESEEA